METETDKQTLTKLHLLNMNDSLSLRLTSRKQYRGKKLTVRVENISKSKKSKHGTVKKQFLVRSVSVSVRCSLCYLHKVYQVVINIPSGLF